MTENLRTCIECKIEKEVFPFFTKRIKRSSNESETCFKCKEKFKSRRRREKNKDKLNKYHLNYYHNHKILKRDLKKISKPSVI